MAKRDMARTNSLRTILFDGCPELFDGEVRRLAQFDERLLLRGDFRCHRRNPGGNVLGDGLNPVQVAMQYVSGLDLQSADLNRRADFDDVNIGVRYRNAPGEKLEAKVFGGRYRPYRAVGNGAD